MNDDTKEELVECPKCGSTEFCIIHDLEFLWVYDVTCKQCNGIFGSLDTSTIGVK